MLPRNPEFEAARRDTVDALSKWFRDRVDKMMVAAPPFSTENPVMLEFEEGKTYDLPLRPFQTRPLLISAMVMDKPFSITRGEWYYAQFQAGDYLCFDENGKPFGMPPDRFLELYDPTPTGHPEHVLYRASFAEDGSVLLEPA